MSQREGEISTETVIGEEHIATAAVVVAHPDDETIWAGGTILMHPEWQWTVVSLCRGSDPDRAPRFFRALEKLGASGRIGDLDDGLEQSPLPESEVQQMILSLLPRTKFSLILTHSPYGEYTRHRRHEETSRAIVTLWRRGILSVSELWMFAYEDGGKCYLPRAIRTAHRSTKLSHSLWGQKYRLITEIYGFKSSSFEAKTTPQEEAFWCFRSMSEFQRWLKRSAMIEGESYESAGSI